MMRPPGGAVLAVALALALVPGCRHPQGGDDGDDAPAVDAPAADARAVDAPEGVGCSPWSPRSAPPETFVGPTGLSQRLTQLIDGAQTSLDVAMYLFTVTALADRLIAARDRGVAVRVLLDPDHPGNVTVRDRLAAAGVAHRDAPTLYSYSHEKYVLVDRAAAVIMSMNFSADAMTSERNYGMIDRDRDDVADLQAVFDMDWAGAGGEPPRPADLACTRLLVAPINARVRTLDLIDRARATLEVEALYVAELGVRDAIGAAKTRGVAVRVIIESSTDTADEIAYFTGLGIPVRGPVGFYNHAKLIVSDGVALVGSENFSQTSLTRNREVAALVFEPAAAEKIRQQFEADWAAGN